VTPADDVGAIMIRRCDDPDFETVLSIINDGSAAYKGVIPADRWTEPYMSHEHLRDEMQDGVEFWAYEVDGQIMGVMGIQAVKDVTLIRHAYVRTNGQKQGIGAKLLEHLRTLTRRPILIGTWKDATWAIRFYEKHGFRLVDDEEKDRLLKQYWDIPERQVETSVVLVEKQLTYDDRASASAD
jgi:N-acetylglutamate synthase-like GNAT family acetyltransferase